MSRRKPRPRRRRPRARAAAPAGLDPILQWAVDAGVMSEAQARDVDALADGITARQLAGELTAEQALELAAATAIRDAQAVNRARARRIK